MTTPALAQVYADLITQIVREMQKIMGPVAVTLANKVPGLNVGEKKVSITGNPEKVIFGLLEQYMKIVGNVAITIAKKQSAFFAAKYPNLKVPKELRGY
jgi:hypothetical protein